MSEPGVPFERTQLAWRRTLLACAVVALLAARMAAEAGAPLIGAAALVGWPAMYAVFRRRIRARPAEAPAAGPRSARAGDPQGRLDPSPSPRSPDRTSPAPRVRQALLVVALTTVGYAFLGAVLVLFG